MCLLVAFVLCAGSAWSETTTYTFNSMSWGATLGSSAANWTSGKSGNQFTSGRGIQVTSGASGANGTSPTSFTNVSKVVVTYSTNAAAGAGNISVQVGSNSAISKNVTTTGGTTDRTLEYTFSPVQEGKVKITVTCTKNSIYIKKVDITTSVPITSISFDKSEATVDIGGTVTITPTISPAGYTETPVWASDDTDVATVSNGVVTGVAEGTALITLTSPSNASIYDVCEVTVNAATTVATPTLSVVAGTYNVAQSVELACLTDGATIRYTTDGTDPTESSSVYSSAITVDRTMTIKAKAFKDGLTASDVVSAIYTLQCVAPTFSPASASTLAYGTEITINSTTDGATIYYTTNGDTPTTSSSVYNDQSKPTITTTQTFKAIAAMDGWSNSEVSSAAYTLKFPDDPTFSLEAGMVSKGVTLSLTSEGATIRYTTDGTTPTASDGTVYTEPITINSAQTIKAVAYDAGGNESDVVTKAYTVFVGDVVTFDATSDTGTSPLSKGGVTFTCSSGVLNNGTEYRLYKSSTTTFSVTNSKIKKIEFTCKSSNAASGFGTLSGFETDGNNGVWTGDATSVTFTASNKQVQATLIKVYVAKTAAPTFSVVQGEYSSAQSVALSCDTDDADIYYTLDGSTPSSSSNEYTGAITITETTTLKAIAIYDGVESNVTSATYTMNRPVAPTFDPAACVFDTAFDLHLNTDTDGATIYYTTDGSTPTTASSVYSTKVAISTATTTVKAIAVKSGLTSDVSSATYTYDSRTTPTFNISSTDIALKVNDEGSFTLTTNHDGSITTTSSDLDHLIASYTSGTKTCSLLADLAGTYTVTVRATGSATYKDAEAVVNVTVTKKETTMAIETLFENGKDLFSASEGLIEGIVKYNDVALSPQPAISYSSSDETVATVNNDGEIAFLKAGSTTITAAFAGDNEYMACEGTYVLNLIDSTPQETNVTVELNSTTLGSTYPDGKTATNNNVSVTTNTGDATNDLLANSAHVRMYKYSNLVVSAPAGYRITNIVFNEPASDKTWNDSPEASTGTYSSKAWTGNANAVTFTFDAGQCRIASITVTLAPVVTIGASGYASYCSPYKLDFSESDVKAYKASVNNTTGKVTLSQIDVVPVNTGVILHCETADTYAIPVTTKDASDVTGNEMVGVTEETNVVWSPSDGVYNYILQQGTFKKASEDGGKLRANRAYLSTSYDVTSAGVRSLTIVFDDDETGINAIEDEQVNGTIYNLAGQRLNKPQKGINIINGKKVFVK